MYELIDGKDLSEIGPRFVLLPLLILEGCMEGQELYRNEVQILL